MTKKERIKQLFNAGYTKHEARKKALNFCTECYFNSAWGIFWIEKLKRLYPEVRINTGKPKEAFSKNEMDYGSDYPQYKISDLSRAEKAIYQDIKFKFNKQ